VRPVIFLPGAQLWPWCCENIGETTGRLYISSAQCVTHIIKFLCIIKG
jgi:hypothetical protein